MDLVLQWIFHHALYAHWIFFGILLLSGLNIPISEDLIIILSASLAATLAPENTAKLFAAIFLGCYLSDCVCYSIGRFLGPKLWELSWFARAIKKKRMEQIQSYYQNYGFWTLLVGRFIPFGVRNALFLSAGLGKMPFRKFLVSDGIACALSNSTLFTLAYLAGQHYEMLLSKLKTFNIFLFLAFAIAGISFIWYKRGKKLLK